MGAKIRSQVKWLKHVGARRGTAGWLCRKPESTGWRPERTLRAQCGGLMMMMPCLLSVSCDELMLFMYCVYY